MVRKHNVTSHSATVIPFARPKKAPAQPRLGPDRDKAIIDHFRRRLAFEREMMRGSMTKLEKVEGHMELTAELLHIAEQFDL